MVVTTDQAQFWVHGRFHPPPLFFAKQFCSHRSIHTGPDSTTLSDFSIFTDR
jgi:hypothetical protein